MRPFQVRRSDSAAPLLEKRHVVSDGDRNLAAQRTRVAAPRAPCHGVTAPNNGLFFLGDELIEEPQSCQSAPGGRASRFRWGRAEDAQELINTGPPMFGDGFDFFRSDVGLTEPQDSLASLPPCGKLPPSANQNCRGQRKPDRRLGFTEPAAPGDFTISALTRPARGRSFVIRSDRPLRLGPDRAWRRPLPHSLPWNLKFVGWV